MEVLGPSSWRFEESARDDLLHLALFVRDAAGIPVPPGPAVPPRLAGAVPDHHDLLGEDERQTAGRQWDTWWTDLLVVQGQWAVQAQGMRRERAGCPPDFAALADRPALHRVVVECWPQARHWLAPRRDQSRGCFDDQIVRQIAEDVAFDHAVDVGAVRGRAVVLDVEGSWWHVLSPGTVVCSTAATSDPETAQLVLRRAYESGLRR